MKFRDLKIGDEFYDEVSGCFLVKSGDNLATCTIKQNLEGRRELRGISLYFPSNEEVAGPLLKDHY